MEQIKFGHCFYCDSYGVTLVRDGGTMMCKECKDYFNKRGEEYDIEADLNLDDDFGGPNYD